jgi:carbamoyltransferase
MSYIIGISAFYHDSAATLINNGEIIAAAQEERFTRIKNDASFPIHAIKYILEEANINLDQIQFVTFYDKPFLKFERLLETYIAFAPKGFNQFRISMPIWIKEKLYLKNILIKELKKIDNKFKSQKLLFSKHHLSHAASAFYPSPFDEAIIISVDGVGEWATTTVAHGKGNRIKMLKEINFPHSLGLLYSAFTYYIGFKVNSGEYKLMGLAPYGKPKYENIILEKLINLKKDGSFHLDLSYFDFATGFKMTNNKFNNLFGNKRRDPEAEEITQFHMDIASSIQSVTEKVMLNITKSLAEEFNINNLCMAGGVALNCVSNGKINRDQSFKNIWVQPAAGDAGGSLGAALLTWYGEMKSSRQPLKLDSMKGSFLGPSFSNEQIKINLNEYKCNYKYLENHEIYEIAAKLLAEGNVLGLFQGRMEFGPRALGSRSILADPRDNDMQKKLNEKIKFREGFRPFAPSILEEHTSEWFNLKVDSPYMSLVDFVNKNKRLAMKSYPTEGFDKLNIKNSEIPAVTHVDYSSRIQTVDKIRNPFFYSILNEFKKITGCPILVNTSFNVRGEPIVCKPTDAIRCFMNTNMDVLIIGNFILYKTNQEK